MRHSLFRFGLLFFSTSFTSNRRSVCSSLPSFSGSNKYCCSGSDDGIWDSNDGGWGGDAHRSLWSVRIRRTVTCNEHACTVGAFYAAFGVLLVGVWRAPSGSYDVVGGDGSSAVSSPFGREGEESVMFVMAFPGIQCRANLGIQNFEAPGPTLIQKTLTSSRAPGRSLHIARPHGHCTLHDHTRITPGTL